MKIYKTLNIGAFHTNHCEDFLIEEQIENNKRLIAVMDGCTMGDDAVFASILLGKILRKIAKQKFYEDFLDKETKKLSYQLKEVTIELINETKIIKNRLGLEVNELLSTLIIGIIQTKEAKAEFLTIGDGLICVDGKLFEYEQNDKPDYLAYHLSEDVELWYDQQKQRLSIDHFKDLSICTDGIFTFKNFKDRSKQQSENEIINYLLIDDNGSEFDNLLERKIQTLREDWNHVVTDDIAIVRIKR